MGFNPQAVCTMVPLTNPIFGLFILFSSLGALKCAVFILFEKCTIRARRSSWPWNAETKKSLKPSLKGQYADDLLLLECFKQI